MIITKEEFIQHLNLLKEMRQLEIQLCTLLTQMSDNGTCNLSLYGRYETSIISLLKHAMNIDAKNDWIEYFIYDLNFGTKFKLGCLVEADGEAIDLSTSEALYEYLCKYYVGRK